MIDLAQHRGAPQLPGCIVLLLQEYILYKCASFGSNRPSTTLPRPTTRSSSPAAAPLAKAQSGKLAAALAAKGAAALGVGAPAQAPAPAPAYVILPAPQPQVASTPTTLSGPLNIKTSTPGEALLFKGWRQMSLPGAPSAEGGRAARVPCPIAADHIRGAAARPCTVPGNGSAWHKPVKQFNTHMRGALARGPCPAGGPLPSPPPSMRPPLSAACPMQ
jgi:hypothetical protein